MTLLNLQPDGAIGVARLPPDYGEQIELEPGATREAPLRASLPAGYPSGADVLKVFAATRAVRFAWLELPPLDAAAPSAAARGLPENPLEELLAALAAEAPHPRLLGPAGHAPGEDWTAAQVRVEIRRKGS